MSLSQPDNTDDFLLLRDWLEAEGSLTEKLKANTADDKLTLLNAQWLSPIPDVFSEHLPSDEACFLREVTLGIKDSAFWYGRTLIPASTYGKRKDDFDNLHEQSIGQLLFNDESIQRLTLHCAPLDDNAKRLLPSTLQLATPLPTLWARHSRFLIEGAPLFLTEVFLPEFITWLNGN